MLTGHSVNKAELRLREWLKSTDPKRGIRLPSERALALQLNLQHYAINRAMGRLIAEGLVEREGYKLLAAGTAPAPPSFCCHLVIAQRSIYIPSYKRIAKEMGIKLIIHTWESTDEALLVLEKLHSPETEAVVLDPPSVSSFSAWEPISRRLHSLGIPFVCIGQVVPGLASVLTDTQQSLQLALLHLIELGHSEIGLTAPSPTTPVSAEVVQIWGELCRQHGLSDSAHRIHFQNNMRLKEEAGEVASLVSDTWRKITGFVFVTTPDCNMQLLVEQLFHRGRRVPDDISLVFVGDGKIAATTLPPITSVSADVSLGHETAFFLVQRAAWKKKSMGILPPPYVLRIQPQLTVRQSTRALYTGGIPAQPLITAASRLPTTRDTFISPAANAESFDLALRKSYPLASRAFLSERMRFSPVNLEPYVNRPLNFRRGWLGDLPLKQLAPGTREIHGVPFNILGGPKRSDCGSIVFHSAVNITGNAHKLPDKLTIPIGGKVQAVYILHGCGYAKFLHTFAHYEFRNRNTSLDRVPLVSLGQPPANYDPEQPTAKGPPANIQDWWPDFPHLNFPHSRMAPIAGSDGPARIARYVFLYTLEWINPSPETTVTHLEISVDPTHSTTLGVLAITVLKP